MIKKVVQNWEEAKGQIRAMLAQGHPEDYKELVKAVVEHVGRVDEYTRMDCSKIHEIDDGDYQGTLLYIIPEDCYQPSRYWAVKVSYGSCSGCDTLEGIRTYDDGVPSVCQVDQYMTLALHIVQGLREIGDSETY